MTDTTILGNRLHIKYSTDQRVKAHTINETYGGRARGMGKSLCLHSTLDLNKDNALEPFALAYKANLIYYHQQMISRAIC